MYEIRGCIKDYLDGQLRKRLVVKVLSNGKLIKVNFPSNRPFNCEESVKYLAKYFKVTPEKICFPKTFRYD